MGAHWHAGRADEQLSALGSSPDGLSADEAGERLESAGPNEVPRQAGDGPLRILWRQVAQPLIYVLLAAAAVSGLAGEMVDAGVIFGVVVLNALIGFVQEFRAGREMAALAAMAGDQSVVVRGGRSREIDARELVPGDVLVLEAGDKVPADARLLSGRGLMADESLLTGESVPVHKEAADDLPPATLLPERANMLHTGTIVTAGRGRALVVETGAGTELARISELVASADRLQTPLTRAIASFGRRISVVILGVALITFLLALAWGYEPIDGFLAAVALAVAAIPEGLPAIVTIALAVGVRRMARRNALVRQLPAVETLGSTTVICTDKTGTLTRGEMAVAELYAGDTVRVTGVGYAPEGDLLDASGEALDEPPQAITALLEGAVLASDARLTRDDGEWRIVGDTTEGALIVAARKAGIEHAPLRERHPRRDVLPFAPEHRYMATLHGRSDGRHPRVLMKGAPEVVVTRCNSCSWADEWDEAAMLQRAEQMAARGMRVLAVADAPAQEGDDELDHEDVRHGNRLIGLIGSIDPPRPEAVAAVGVSHRAGIRVVMITGDHPRTAQAIAADIGIDHGMVVTGEELEDVPLDRLERTAAEVSVFARVAPEHKLALVAALQRRGEVVAMTGDGANDAPALTQADVGVAMGRAGTDAARESADIVLRDDNFATIEAAVEEGRRVYDNLVKSIAFILPTSAGQAMLVLAAIAVGLSLPLLPVQVLWINLITAVGLALPLSVEAREPGLMDRPPRAPGRPILGRFVLERIVLVAALMTAAGIAVFEFESAMGAELPEARASVATTIMFVQVGYLFACRTLRASPWEVGFFTNPWIHVGIVAVIALQAAYVYLPVMNTMFDTAPIGAREWLMALAPALVTLVAVEVHRRVYGRLRRG
jgi:magnesium-transporting ATPase (P-type)